MESRKQRKERRNRLISRMESLDACGRCGLGAYEASNGREFKDSDATNWMIVPEARSPFKAVCRAHFLETMRALPASGHEVITFRDKASFEEARNVAEVLLA